jgi:hypothetical protein
MSLVELDQFADRVFADLARARLAASGIESVIFDGAISSLGLGPIIPARLMVDEADAKAAQAILDQPGELAGESE